MPLARAHAFVSGRVQGVGYRFATVDEARRLGLRGWVRNLADGRVELEAEGERSQVEALLAFCRHGPPAAAVDGVEIEWAAHRGDLSPFAAR
ncbi:MAG TPA: acylphosphatase, partial [Anaeromyxobacteraceae bacterium]|nr:acylphosphatase [Anaeromyxobacteraceae bacterium]